MRNIAFVFWLIISLYLCIGGITNTIILKKFEEAKRAPLFKDTGLKDKNGDWFRNIAELEANVDYGKMTSFYPLYEYSGDTFSYISTLMGFGVLGTMIKILITISLGKNSLNTQNVYTLPVLGALLGLLVLVLSELLPEFKYKSGNDKLFYSIALLCGLYAKEFFSWLEKKFISIFTI